MKSLVWLGFVLLSTCLGQTGATGEQEADARQLRLLEEQARALANPNGCAESGQCATAPVGERACGGPRDYVVYCPLTTDTAALLAKLKELQEAEGAYNRKYQIVSTCEHRMPPPVESVGGVCRAVAH